MSKNVISHYQNFIDVVNYITSTYKDDIVEMDCFGVGCFICYLKERWFYDEELKEILNEASLDTSNLQIRSYWFKGLTSSILIIGTDENSLDNLVIKGKFSKEHKIGENYVKW